MNPYASHIISEFERKTNPIDHARFERLLIWLFGIRIEQKQEVIIGFHSPVPVWRVNDVIVTESADTFIITLATKDAYRMTSVDHYYPSQPYKSIGKTYSVRIIANAEAK